MISYNYQDTTFILNQEEAISAWILDTFVSESIIKDIDLNIIFCSDEELLTINIAYLNHDYYTDIITFPLEETSKELSGELYISVDRVQENAETFEDSFTNEMHRVIIHGILHLCGYTDKTPEHEKQMRQKEDFYLEKRHFIA